MKPITLQEVNAAIAECEDLAEPFYESEEKPFRIGLSQALACRGVSMFVTQVMSDAGIRWSTLTGGMQDAKIPVGVALNRFNRILETIPEPEGVEA